jgi:hypothetical protein
MVKRKISRECLGKGSGSDVSYEKDQKKRSMERASSVYVEKKSMIRVEEPLLRQRKV